MIVHTGTVNIGNRETGSVGQRSEIVRRGFIALAPEEANAIVGVQIATDVVLYDIGGGGSLYLTFIGNPAVVEEA